MNKKTKSKFKYTSTRSDPTLKRWFRKYNKELFGGRLPKNTRVIWANGPGAKNWIGLFEPFPDQPPKILVHTCLLKLFRVARMVLIHEMSHEEMWIRGKYAEPDHGPRFQSIMKRHAKRDAFRDLW